MSKVLRFFKRLLILLVLVLVGTFIYRNFIRQKNIGIVYHDDAKTANAYANSLSNKNLAINMMDLSRNDVDLYIKLLDKMDGVIFAGGNDFDPAIYGGGNRDLLEDYDFEEDKKDIKILQAALDRDLPVLGICRGCQLININFGGSLYEDLPSQFSKEVSHRDGKNKFSRHMVNIEKGSRLSKIIRKDSIEANSYHHQGIKDLGQGLLVSARSDDGLVEAIENPSYTYLVGIQWHPEADSWDEASQEIFDDFLKNF